MMALEERFWPKVDVGASGLGCWWWEGSGKGGYGKIGAGPKGLAPLQAHRAAYELLVGPIPEGMVLDHLCRNPSCVNPDHLEVVTQAENNRRRGLVIKHCPRGHAYDEKNTYIKGGRHCRTCRRQRRAKTDHTKPITLED